MLKLFVNVICERRIFRGGLRVDSIKGDSWFVSLIRNNAFQKWFIGSVTFLLAFLIVLSGATPKVYQLNLGDKSDYDITAPKEVQTLKKGQRIISIGDTVTEEKLQVLKELNLLKNKSKVDYCFFASIFGMMMILAIMLFLYMRAFCKYIFKSRSDLVLLSIIMLLTLLMARFVNEYSSLAIPIFVAAMLTAILLDYKLALVVNFVLTIAASFITKGNLEFIYMALISGSLVCFFVREANQRNKLTLVGVVTGICNVSIIVFMEIINKGGTNVIMEEAFLVFINGIVCVILTIGMLPFLEIAFNIITPIRLLELSNPNQPLIKRLLTEAPGTYHHSLMVGNLAEAGTEAIGGNALLARVGAYFHDIGKLKRPNFFKENQLTDNPHERMTANLSTLVITAHTHDGVELAKQFKIPMPIRDIILEHHGTTLVACFYHKAKTNENREDVSSESFRYDGPKPTTNEAAVVMLADCVEASVRSMVHKTEGKIEGVVRKIIKDKLEDGQLDQCKITLKDLDEVARAFMRVLSGYFHARDEYPDIKKLEANRFKQKRVHKPTKHPA